MISPEQAFSILDKLNYSERLVELSLLEARNHVLAETIFSPMNMPPFRQATMDGFAICLHDSLHYEIVGEVNIELDHGYLMEYYVMEKKIQ